MAGASARAVYFLAGSVVAACTVFNGYTVDVDAGAVRPDAETGVPDASEGGALGDATPVSPGCDHCEAIAVDQGTPTDLRLLGTTLWWIRYEELGIVMHAELDGGSLQDADEPIHKGRDLTFQGEQPFVIDSIKGATRLEPGSFCPNTDVLRLATVEANLLFVNGDGLSRGDCGGDTKFLHETPGPLVAVGDDTYVWYSRANGEVVRCQATTADCENSRTILAASQGQVQTLAVDPARVYWATGGSAADVRTKLKKDIGTADPPLTLASGQAAPKTIVPAGNDVYWTNLENGTVMRASVSGATPAVPIASGLNGPWGLVVTADFLYVTESGAGRVLRIPR